MFSETQQTVIFLFYFKCISQWKIGIDELNLREREDFSVLECLFKI
jgi:hypothetical protein